MKQLFTFFVLTSCHLLCGAQATSLTVDNQTPGWLSSKINYGDQQTVENLTITGYLNAEDLSFVGILMQKQNLSKVLDLSDAKIVGVSKKEDNSIAFNNIFSLTDSVRLDKLLLPTSIDVPVPTTRVQPLKYVYVNTLVYGSSECNIFNNALWGCYSGTYGSCGAPKELILREGVDSIADYACDSRYGGGIGPESIALPSSLKYIGKCAFVNCKLIQELDFPPNIEEIGFEAFYETSFLPDTLRLPMSLKKYFTRSFPIKNSQVVYIPNSVSEIDNTYETYSNTFNTWTTHDHITYTNNYIWIIECATPPKIKYSYEKCLKSSTLYIPRGSYAEYSTKKPYQYAKLKELVPIKNVSFYGKAFSRYVGDEFKITPELSPTGANHYHFIWYSSNQQVAEISADGLIKTLSCGETVITVRDEISGCSASFTLDVYLHVTEISLISEAMIKLGEKIILKPQLEPQGQTNENVIWKTSDPSVAVVDEKGVVSAVGLGVCNIMATAVDGGLSATCEVRVIQSVESIDIEKDIVVVNGSLFNLDAKILPKNVWDPRVEWSISDPAVVEIYANRNEFIDGYWSVRFRALAPGTSTITVTSVENPKIQVECAVTVIQPVTGITLNKSCLELTEDESEQLIATIAPENASDKSVTWTSSDLSVAMISPNGTVYAVKPGRATIMATTGDGGFVALCKVVVNEISGVENVTIDLNEHVKIFNLQGIMLFEGEYSDANVPSGTYIIVSQNRSFKQYIR